MKSSYQKTKWVDNKTPVNAQNLNKIETALEYLHENALDTEDLVGSEDISVEKNEEGKTEIALIGNVVKSQSINKVEWVTGAAESPEQNTLYFILSSDTGKLSSIQLGETTIYTVE